MKLSKILVIDITFAGSVTVNFSPNSGYFVYQPRRLGGGNDMIINGGVLSISSALTF